MLCDALSYRQQKMIDTLQALLVTALAVLPGALYTLARENLGATWAWQGTDTATQIFRFLSASAFFHALLAPLTYWAYSTLVVTHALIDGHRISLWWWGGFGAYIVVPYLWGAVTEWSRNWEESACCLFKWPKRAIAWTLALIGGRDPEPRAWDRLFSQRDLEGYVRLKLLDDRGWKAGLWYDSYASGYGQECDLYIGQEVEIDTHGELVIDETTRAPSLLGRGLLIRWSEVKYLDFTEARSDDDGGING